MKHTFILDIIYQKKNKMKKIITLISIFLFFLTTRMYSQQEAQLSLSNLNPLLINSAYTGAKNIHNLTLNTRLQWVGIEGSPVTQFLSYHGPLKNKNLGVGLVMENDITGARMMQSVFFNTSYSFRLNKKYHRLSFGLNGGFQISQTNFSNLRVNESDLSDPLRVNSVLVSPNVGVGVYYLADNFYAGFSIPRFLSRTNNMALNSDNTIFQPLILLSGGYVFTINPDWKVKVNNVTKIQENTPFQFDIGASVIWLNKVNAGVTYRYHESIIGNFMYKVNKKFYIGYAFDLPVNGLALNQWGSHEISISYEWGKSLNKRKPSSCFEF